MQPKTSAAPRSRDGTSHRTARGGLRVWASLALIGAATIAVLLVYAPPWAPLGRDSGVFAYVGWQIPEGTLPYRDIWDHKPPGIYWLNALAVALPAPRWSLWAMASVTALATMWLATAVLMTTFGRGVGLLCGAVHAAILVDPRIYQDGGNLTETYAGLLQWLVLWGAGRASERHWRFGLAGMAAGTCVLLKPTTAALGLAAFLDLAGRARDEPRGRRQLTAFVAGASLIPALSLLWFAQTGIVAEAFDCIVRFNATYATSGLVHSIGIAAYKCVSGEPYNLLGVLAIASLLVPGWRSPQDSRVARMALIAFPIEFVLIALPGRFYGHYYATLLPALSVRAAAFLAAPLRFGRVRRYAPVIGALLLALALGRLGKQLGRSWPDLQVAHAREQRLVAEVQRRTQPSDSVLVWGAELGVNFMAQRRTIGPYGYSYPLFAPGYTSDAMWQRFASATRRDPPALIVDASRRAQWPVAAIPTVDALAHDAALPADVRMQLATLLESYRKEPLSTEVDLWIRERDAGRSFPLPGPMAVVSSVTSR